MTKQKKHLCGPIMILWQVIQPKAVESREGGVNER